MLFTDSARALAPYVCTTVAAADFVFGMLYYANIVGGAVHQLGPAVDGAGASLRECACAVRSVTASVDAVRRATPCSSRQNAALRP